jgi:hypothetical protein
MPPTVLCPRHGPTVSVFACDHVSAALSSGSEPPASQRLRATLDNSGPVAYCACFDCLDRFHLTPDFTIPPDAKMDGSEFPGLNPICFECLKAAQSPPSDPETIPDAGHKPARPTQVSMAVLLLCVSLVTDVMTMAFSWVHLGPRLSFFSLPEILDDAAMAGLVYLIWLGRSWARAVYAILFGLGLVSALVPGGGINILWSSTVLVALFLLFAPPSRRWFQANSPVR